ncbi:response regulator [Porphyromonas loveana]|uniref:response regulator n=1 Tax=Porphyromonas loveana TaxID=1884669 RepID=UPI0035A0DC94
MTKILLVDDHELYRIGLRAAIAQIQDLAEIIGECGSSQELEDYLHEQGAPDMIILDIRLPDGNGVDIARRLKTEYPDLKIIMLSSEVSEKIVNDLLEIGVEGYMSKMAQTSDIENAIRTVTTGGNFYGKSIAKIIMDLCVSRSAGHSHKNTRKQPNPSELTEREIEVIQHLCNGLSAKETGEKMHLSHRTVETHRSNILHKLGFSNAAELIRYAVKEGLVDWQ